jgi:hypothetical protein
LFLIYSEDAYRSLFNFDDGTGEIKMYVRIGFIHLAKEIEIDMVDGDTDRDKLLKQIDTALNDDKGILWLDDRKGHRTGVLVSKVAYVEVGPSGQSGRRVGFGA